MTNHILNWPHIFVLNWDYTMYMIIPAGNVYPSHIIKTYMFQCKSSFNADVLLLLKSQLAVIGSLDPVNIFRMFCHGSMIWINTSHIVFNVLLQMVELWVPPCINWPRAVISVRMFQFCMLKRMESTVEYGLDLRVNDAEGCFGYFKYSVWST